MKLAQIASRVAVGGVSAALATAGLVGVTAATAQAAAVSSDYVCTSPFGPIAANISVDVAVPATAPAGFQVPAGLLSFKSNLTVSNATASSLNGAGVTGGKSDDFGTAFGAVVAKAPVVWSGPPTTDGTNTTFPGKGANAAFQLPAAGTYSVTMPKQFTLVATNSSGGTVTTANCTTAAPAQIGTITLSKQASTTKAKAPKSAHKGDVVTVKVTVKNEFQKTGGVMPTGKLIVKDGKKKVGKGKLDKKGKATIKVKGLSVGTHSLTVVYKGDAYDQSSTSKAKSVTVK
jgi:hypothetical protein